MTGDIGGKRRGKKDRSPRHVLGRSHPSLRDMRECPLQPVGILRRHLGQLGIDQPRREAVYADTVGGEGLPQRLGQADRPGLRRGIGGVADIGLQPRNRTDDDGPCPGTGSAHRAGRTASPPPRSRRGRRHRHSYSRAPQDRSHRPGHNRPPARASPRHGPPRRARESHGRCRCRSRSIRVVFAGGRLSSVSGSPRGPMTWAGRIF